MTKHTPGPWEAAGLCIIGKPVGPKGWPNMIGQATQNLNAEPYQRSYEEACANVALMAAAPEMLDVLLVCRDEFNSMHEYGYDMSDMLDKIDAVFDKLTWE